MILLKTAQSYNWKLVFLLSRCYRAHRSRERGAFVMAEHLPAKAYEILSIVVDQFSSKLEDHMQADAGSGRIRMSEAPDQWNVI
jgi:hypothetical protein